MIEVFDCINEEFALLYLQGNSSITKGNTYFIGTLDVLLHRFRDNYDVVDVKEAGFPFYAIVYDVQSTLEGNWGFCDAERHASVFEMTGVTYEGPFSTVLFPYVNLPVTVELIERFEDAGITKSVDTFVHAGDMVPVFDRHRVKHPVVERKHPSFLGANNTDDEHSELDGSMTPAASCFLTSDYLISFLFGRSDKVPI